MSSLWLLFASVLLVAPRVAGAQDLHPEDAIGGLLGALNRHRIVAVAEGHRVVQDKEFLLKLIATSELERVNDIVIEFGNARLQPVLDRYMAGKGMSRDELRPVWADSMVVNGLWDAPIYEQFLAAVRERNQRLPKCQRFRVLAYDLPSAGPGSRP